jgi:hypothetical protein
MLDAFDAGRRKARGHEVEVYHGRVAEAEFRKWLEGFLPKRFGVTPGYVVSQGQRGSVKYPHFDVVIYDQMESPILWIEDHPDVSERGAARAIPAEHVRAILEVKSTYSPRTAAHALEHLRDLEPLSVSVDPPGERYKKYLPAGFFCAAVFFETEGTVTLPDLTFGRELVPNGGPKNFFGGHILRGKGLDPQFSCSVRITIELSREGMEIPPGERQLGTLPMWSQFAFSMFAFDVVALLSGTYDHRFLSSFHAIPLSDLPPT